MEKSVNTENKILKVLTGKKFCSKKPDQETFNFILERIKKAVNSLKPIVLVIGFGYHKNPNTTSNFLPDLTEELSLLQLYKLSKKVEEVYEPGMIINIITSGKRAEMVNHTLHSKTSCYHEALISIAKRRLVKKDKNVIKIIPISHLYKERWEEFLKTLQEIEKDVIKSLNNDSEQDFWKKEIEHARRNIDCSQGNIEKRAKKAAFRYVLFRKAEEVIGLFEKKFPDAITASYNSGHKNTITLWTLGPGDVTQPWQGKARWADGKVIVMTKKRQKKYE